MKTRDFDTIRASNKRFFENRGLKGGAEQTVFYLKIFNEDCLFLIMKDCFKMSNICSKIEQIFMNNRSFFKQLFEKTL